MNKLKWILTTAVGMLASGNGFFQAEAAVFAYQVDFLDKEVANFDNFNQSFFVDTYDLEAKIKFTWSGLYYWSLPGKSLDATWQFNYRLNGVGSFIQLASLNLPDFAPGTFVQTYTAEAEVPLPDEVVEAVMQDDANFVEFSSGITFLRRSTNWGAGSFLYFENNQRFFNLEYNFNTTYLFNYFLSDQKLESEFYSAGFTQVAPLNHFLEYVYTTAGNDTYLIENSLQVDIGTTRKKYAINVDDVYFRGNSVGAQFRSGWDGTLTGVLNLEPTTNAAEFEVIRYRYFYLNTANYQQPIGNVPEFNFTYEDCGSFLALNVGCFVNNALAYLTNDAPIISDAFTLLNAGLRLGGQAFSVIGQFTTGNVFGVLVLSGLGITAVRWFLKND